jgi:hypothetical protein
VSEENVHSHQEIDSVGKLVHLALPVRLTHMASGGRGGLEMACTYDIHPRGARLLSFRDVRVGDLITVERGRNKSVCQVVWTADPKSPLRGQFTVECVEGNRSPWEEELRHMQETYLPMDALDTKKLAAVQTQRRGDQNRRRSPRFHVEGGADLLQIGGPAHVAGQLEEISAHGCMIRASDLLTPGTGLRMVLNIYDVSVALKGSVKYAAENRSMGVEFREIRQGDRPLLDYVLNHLKKPRSEDFSDLEVITEELAVAG